MTARRFEYTGGSSYKFWEVWQLGSAHHVRFGKIGTDGQERSKDHPSALAARQAIRKFIREKADKGYVEITAPLDTFQVVRAQPIAPAKPKPKPKPKRTKLQTGFIPPRRVKKGRSR